MSCDGAESDRYKRNTAISICVLIDGGQQFLKCIKSRDVHLCTHYDFRKATKTVTLPKVLLFYNLFIIFSYKSSHIDTQCHNNLDNYVKILGIHIKLPTL